MTAERKPLLRARPTEAPLDVSWRRDGVLGTLRLLWTHLLTSRGLIVSLGFHLILLLIAFVWVISVMKDQRVKQPEFMATGAGGGANGDRARILEHNLQQKKAKATAKAVARITSKNPTSTIALPELPMSKMPDTSSTRNSTIVYSDGMRSNLPTDDRKPAEKHWEDELVNAFAGAKSGRGPRLYLFSTQVEPQPIFNRCVLASGGQIKMVEWLRTGGNPPADDEQVIIGQPAAVRALR